MDDFDRIEEQRERNEPLAYEAWREEIDDSDAYDISDPKHPDHYDTYADAWDMREGK